MLRSALDKDIKEFKKFGTRRKPYGLVLIVKTLYKLSDEKTEFQIKNRLSFMRFLDRDFKEHRTRCLNFVVVPAELANKEAINHRKK